MKPLCVTAQMKGNRPLEIFNLKRRQHSCNPKSFKDNFFYTRLEA